MALETSVDYIDELVVTNPAVGDPRSEGDDHIRNTKTALKNTFPGMVGRAWRVQSKAANYSPVISDNMTLLVATAALSLTPVAAATLGNGFMFLAYASGGDVTINPDGAETVNGQATLTIPVSYMALVMCEGTQFFAAVFPTLAPWTTGDAKLTLKTVADSGWIMATDGTIGSAASGATRANADTLPLYTLVWNGVAEAQAPVQDQFGAGVLRGANAAADWAANKRLVLPKMLGRSLAVAGAGSGLTARLLGAIAGNETHTLTEAQMPVHDHPINDPGHAHTTNAGSPLTPSGGGPQFPQYSPGTPTSTNVTGITVLDAGGGAAHPILDPTAYLNVMIKL